MPTDPTLDQGRAVPFWLVLLRAKNTRSQNARLRVQGGISRAYEALRRGDAAAAGFFALLLAAVFVPARLLVFADAARAVVVLAAVLRAGAFFGAAALAGAALAGALAAPAASGL